MTIDQLIKKYEKPTPGERYTKEYKRKLNQESQRKNRHLLLDSLLNETPFTLPKYQVDQIRYWIDRFNKDFKNFHRRSSNETILLAFIFIQRRNLNPYVQIEKYSICNKYNLTTPIFETIQNRLIFQLMKTTELRYNQKEWLDLEYNKTNDE